MRLVKDLSINRREGLVARPALERGEGPPPTRPASTLRAQELVDHLVELEFPTGGQPGLDLGPRETQAWRPEVETHLDIGADICRAGRAILGQPEQGQDPPPLRADPRQLCRERAGGTRRLEDLHNQETGPAGLSRAHIGEGKVDPVENNPLEVLPLA